MKENIRIFRLFFARHPDFCQPPRARTEKVARLRDAVRHGEYQVDARKVAQAFLKEHFINQMIMQVRGSDFERNSGFGWHISGSPMGLGRQ